MSSINLTDTNVQQKSISTARSKSCARGWNSWLTYGFSVNEQEVLQEADAMSGLLGGAGFDTLVLDAQWYVDRPTRARAGHPDPNVCPNLDGYGRFLPSLTRFPSTDGNGFRPLVERLALNGQKLGVHLMRGIPRVAVAANLPVYGSQYSAGEIANAQSTCTWNLEMYGLKSDHPGSRDYYRSVIQLISDWGVDYIKYDDLGSPYHHWDIATIREAINDLAPHIRFSLSPGPVPAEHVHHARDLVDYYRVGPDLWDRWKDVAYNIRAVADIAIEVNAALPDLDMLPIGRIGRRAEIGRDRLSSLSPLEVETMFVFYSFTKSPLLLGGEISTISEADLCVLSSRFLQEIHQSPAPVATQSITNDVIIATTEVNGVRLAVCANVADEHWYGEIPYGIGRYRIEAHSYRLFCLEPFPKLISLEGGA